uniref:spermatogenesis-associated serine-rich protein 2-like isoform X4 n=1 Tax=Pristiophorus japonicus TaxID=55135 RepID=UPI00398E3931
MACSRATRKADPTGVVFDTRSKAVMAQGASNDNIKEKITAVRAIVPNRSNNEIILVLQHYDNCVDKAVQAFMEGYAAEVLKEWSVTRKKKNKKKKVKPKPQVKAEAGQLQPSKSADRDESVLEDEKCKAVSKFQPSQHSSHSLRTYQQKNTTKSRLRTASASQSSASLSLAMPDNGAFVSSKNKKIGANIEKSAKDLQRCTVSLARYRTVIKEEMDTSIKKMKVAFAELQNCFMDREVALLGEMDKVKAEALEILDGRQKRAEALKKMTDSAVRMSEEQLVELRADIKHFVSERKYDEDLGRCAQFTCDVEELKASIQAFGQVSHPKNNYSARSRCSSVSSMSVTSRSDVSAPPTPDCASDASLTKPAKKTPSSGDVSTATANAANQTFVSNRPVFHGNRRPGYRPRENRINGPSHFGRNDDRTRYRNGPRNYSNARYNPQTAPHGFTTDQSQMHSTASSDAAAPSAPRPSSLPPAPAGALPQRRPRSNGNEAPVNS